MGDQNTEDTKCLQKDDQLKEENIQSQEEKRTKFGNRFLTNPQNIFQHNAWDNVVWDDEQEAEAKSIAEKHMSQLIADGKKEELESNADAFWDKFYSQHQNRFFKDRHWLFIEFPELYGQEHVFDPSDEDSNVEGSSKSNYASPHLSSELNELTLCSKITEDIVSVNSSAKLKTKISKDPLRDIESKQASVVEESSGDMAEKLFSNGSIRLLEVGCGVGNTVFPVLNTNKNPGLMVYCCDFSSTAVQILKDHPDYDKKRCCAFVWDITEERRNLPIEQDSLDIVIMIFILSALSPDKMQAAVDRVGSYLKPGGSLLFRDYGRYDMAQLRFKQGRCISENFYVRGDGTRVYFFTQEELDAMFHKAGLVKKENLIDRRLQVNRGRQLKMYRVWIQCKYVKVTESQNVPS